MILRARSRLAVRLSLALLLAGCSDPTGPGTGRLFVSVGTTGSPPDPDGYTVVIDGNPVASLPPGGGVTISELHKGNHAVRLAGIASNCSAHAANPTQADIQPGKTDTLSLAVVCATPISNRIIFQSGRNNEAGIWLMDFDGGDVTGLTPAGVFDQFPAVSPDGGRIASVAYRTEDGVHYDVNIQLTNADGGNPVQLSHGDGDSYPAWAPGGMRIAFMRFVGSADIILINPDGSGEVNVTQSPTVTDQDPAWSPDGRRLAFSARSGPDESDIYVVNADGTGLTNITPQTPGNDWEPAWSPDGQMIAFASDRGGSLQIYLMFPDGSGVSPLANAASYNGFPTWSPDGSRLAFRTTLAGPRYDIYVMSAFDSSNPIRLTNDALGNVEQIEWLPDGSRVIGVIGPMQQEEIYSFMPDGSGSVNLTNDPAGNNAIQIVPGP